MTPSSVCESSACGCRPVTATLRETLAAVLRCLAAFGEPYAVVGGMAVILRARARFTRDIDKDAAADRLDRGYLRRAGASLELDASLEAFVGTV